MQLAVDLDRDEWKGHLRPPRLGCRWHGRRRGEILVIEVGGQVRVAGFVVCDNGDTVVFCGALVTRHNVPPQPAAEFAFQRREVEVPSVAVEANGLGGAGGEAVKGPIGAAAVVVAETRLFISCSLRRRLMAYLVDGHCLQRCQSRCVQKRGTIEGKLESLLIPANIRADFLPHGVIGEQTCCGCKENGEQ